MERKKAKEIVRQIQRQTNPSSIEILPNGGGQYKIVVNYGEEEFVFLDKTDWISYKLSKGIR